MNLINLLTGTVKCEVYNNSKLIENIAIPKKLVKNFKNCTAQTAEKEHLNIENYIRKYIKIDKGYHLASGFRKNGQLSSHICIDVPKRILKTDALPF